MCGRFTLITPINQLAERFHATAPLEGLKPRYNAAPTQLLPVILSVSPAQISVARWGLIPHWAKDESIGNRMINARAETIAEKPAFRSLLGSKRCLILADGFYEWKKSGAQKIPHRITLKDEKPFAFAGLYDEWEKEGKRIQSFTIITTQPNELMKGIHDRMPVILAPNEERAWLENGDVALLDSYPACELRAYRVSQKVNSPANDVPELIVEN